MMQGRRPSDCTHRVQLGFSVKPYHSLYPPHVPCFVDGPDRPKTTHPANWAEGNKELCLADQAQDVVGHAAVRAQG